MLNNTHAFPLCLLLLFYVITRFSFNHKDVFSAWLIIFIKFHNLSKCRKKYIFMAFCKFLAYGKSPVFPKNFCKFSKCLFQAVRCLIYNHGSCLIFKLRNNISSLLLVRRQECFKTKSSCRQPRHSKCCHTCCRSRK